MKKKLNLGEVKDLQKRCGTYAIALMLRKRGFSLETTRVILAYNYW